MIRFVLALALVGAWAAPGLADVMVLKEGSALVTVIILDPLFVGVTAGNIVNVDVADTGFHSNPNSNNQAGTAVIIDENYPDNLFKFDLSTLDDLAGATINKAQLALYHTAGNSGNNIGTVLYHDWSEVANRTSPTGSITVKGWGPLSDSKFGAADYVITSTMAQSSFETNALFGTGTCKWLVGDVTASLQAMIDGSASNFGWYVYDSIRKLVATENVNDAYRPALYIDYTPVPEPATIGLLVLGGLAMIHRRR